MRVKALTALIVTPALLYLAINAAGTSSSSIRPPADGTAEAATHKVEAQPTAAAGTLTQASAVIGAAQSPRRGAVKMLAAATHWAHLPPPPASSASVEVVVARIDEPLEWTEAYRDRAAFTVPCLTHPLPHML